MTSDVQTVQQQNACAQQEKVKTSIREALIIMRREVDETYDPVTGRYTMPSHWRRLSEAEVLRRAGGVDKNTLKQPYHADVRAELRRFIEFVRNALLEVKQSNERQDNRYARLVGEVARLSQLLAGAEHRLIANQQDVEDWRRRCDWLEARLEERDATIARMENRVKTLLREVNGGTAAVSLRPAGSDHGGVDE